MSNKEIFERTYRESDNTLVKERAFLTPSEMHTVIFEMLEPRYKTKKKKWDLIKEVSTKVKRTEIEDD